MIVGVVVGRQHNEDWPAEGAVDMVGHNALEHRALEDAIEAALKVIEVVFAHRVCLGLGL